MERDEWKEKLTPEQYLVLREGGTEPPFSGDLLNNKEEGVYTCAACGAEIFSSGEKYDSGTGWPSFFDVADSGKITTHPDTSDGAQRAEVRCARCGGHLGHVFPDGPEPTGARYCINSVALGFKKNDKKEHGKKGAKKEN